MSASFTKYGKTLFRHDIAQLDYPAKVDCLINLQEMAFPLNIARGVIRRPWQRDKHGSENDEQARFCAHLQSIVPSDVAQICSSAMTAFREMNMPASWDVKIKEYTNAHEK